MLWDFINPLAMAQVSQYAINRFGGWGQNKSAKIPNSIPLMFSLEIKDKTFPKSVS